MIADLLTELAWKSALLIAILAGLLVALRGHSPANRVAVGGLGVTVLLLLPTVVAMLAWLPMPAIELSASAALPPPVAPLLGQADPALASAAALDAPAAAAFPWATLVALAWAGGAALVLARLAVGLATLGRWTEAAELCDSPQWAAFLRRCGAPEGTELRISRDVPAPLSWGWRRPVILFNPNLPVGRCESEAILAHEAAHLARGDWPRLIATRLAVALFWFNPLVWVVERLYLQAVEEAADAAATARVEPASYAQALLNAARISLAPLGANSMAAGTLSRRIHRVLRRPAESRWEGAWRRGALAGIAFVGAPIAAVQFVSPAMAPAIAAAPARPAASASPAPVSAAAPAATASSVAIETAKAASVIAVAAQAPVAPLPAVEPVDPEAIRALVESTRQVRGDALAAASDARRLAEQARVQTAAAMAGMREQMLKGAQEMERGAVDMRRGAAQMREEARKLRNPQYRAKVIAEQAARGHPVTDQELVDAIPKMEEGARKMDSGVDEMRRGAQRMREQAARH